MNGTRYDAGFSAVELLIAVAILGSIAAMSMPVSTGMIDDIRLRGDSQGVASAMAFTKMTAAAQFTRARLRLDLAAGTYRTEVWRDGGTPGWVTEGPTHQLSTDGRFGAGVVTTAPPNTQAALAQAAACLADDGTAINGTACVVFNSRGLPTTSAGTPAGVQALYLRGPSGVFGIVVGATGQQQVWRATHTPSGTWRQQ
jgi:prepilin-type N-terminal cleavage/methylation domain-containing protein